MDAGEAEAVDVSVVAQAVTAAAEVLAAVVALVGHQVHGARDRAPTGDRNPRRHQARPEILTLSRIEAVA